MKGQPELRTTTRIQIPMTTAVDNQNSPLVRFIVKDQAKNGVAPWIVHDRIYKRTQNVFFTLNLQLLFF